MRAGAFIRLYDNFTALGPEVRGNVQLLHWTKLQGRLKECNSVPYIQVRDIYANDVGASQQALRAMGVSPKESPWTGVNRADINPSLGTSNNDPDRSTHSGSSGSGTPNHGGSNGNRYDDDEDGPNDDGENDGDERPEEGGSQPEQVSQRGTAGLTSRRKSTRKTYGRGSRV